MAKTTFTLEEILQEYGPDGKDSSSKQVEHQPLPSGKLETEKMLSAAAPTPIGRQRVAAPAAPRRRTAEPPVQPEPQRRPAAKEPDDWAEMQSAILTIKQKKERRPKIPEDSAIAKMYQQEAPRKAVSFVQSPAMQARGPAESEEESYDEAVILPQKEREPESVHRPNIRQMESADSAKKRKKRAKRRKTEQKADADFLYDTAEDSEQEERQPAKRPTVQTERPSRFRKKKDKDFFFHLSEDRESNSKPEEDKNVHIPNQDAEILENIHALRNVVFVRTALLLLLSILGCILAFCETPGNRLYHFLIERLSARGYCLLELAMAAIAIVIAFPTIRNGLRNLVRWRADCDSMAVLPMIAGLAATIVTCFSPEVLTTYAVHLYIPAAILALLFNSVGKLLIIRRASRNYGILSKSFEKYVLTYVHTEGNAEQLTRGVVNDLPILAAVRKANQLSDFLRYTYSSDLADHFCKLATPILAIVSLLTAVGLSLIRYGVHWQLQTVCICLSLLAALITISCCMGAALVVNLPLDVVTKRAVVRNRVLLSDQSVDDYYDTNALLLDAATLFPKGSVQVSGIKLFSTFKIDEALLYAVSLVHHAGSFLQDALEDVVPNKKTLYPVEDFQYEDSFGICGWVQNRRILFGNREMMASHNVEGLPTRTREAELAEGSRDILYLSVSGNLAAMFQLNLQADSIVKKWMQELKRERVALVLKSVDSCLSLQKLSALFQFPEYLLKILPASMHDIAEAETAEKDCESATMICDGSFAGIAELLTSAKKVRRASTIGLVLQAVTAILGISLGMAHLAVGAYATLTAQLYILYQLICTAVTVLAVRRLK